MKRNYETYIDWGRAIRELRVMSDNNMMKCKKYPLPDIYMKVLSNVENGGIFYLCMNSNYEYGIELYGRQIIHASRLFGEI